MITADITFKGTFEDESTWEHNAWEVTLRNGRKKLTTEYRTGMALGEPTAAEVLGSLLLDAGTVRHDATFEDFCFDLGYDSDSRKAEAAYKACKKTYRDLFRFLGVELFPQGLNAGEPDEWAKAYCK